MKLQVHGRLYDLTDFVDRHPGGKAILEAWDDGDDVTDAFREYHHGSPEAMNVLHTLPSIRVKPRPEKSSNAVHHLRRRIAHSFLASPLFYARKVTELLGLLSLGILWKWPILTGLGIQQGGWLAHDILHRHILRAHPKTRHWLGMAGGTLLLGMAPSWWKRRHSLHHAKPNAPDVDADIQTLPLIDWFPVVGRANPYQHLYIWGVLPFSKISWTVQSLLDGTHIERGAICARYVAACWFLGGKFVLVSDLWAGLFIAFVFIQSHTGLPYKDTDGFYASQIRTSRNLSQDFVTTWFMGGLNYQIEHHLFPTMPRHAYRHVAPLVRALSKKLKIPYHCETLWQSTGNIARHLRT